MTDLAKKGIVVILLLAMLFALLLGGWQLVFKGCLLWICPPPRSFTVFDLGLPIDFFPEDALVNEIHPSSESFGALESGNMTVYWQGGKGLAVHNIWHFSTEARASDFFEALRTQGGSFPEHNALNFRSQIADDYTIGCGNSQFGGYRCNLYARYEEFTLSFNAVIDNEMAIEKFEQIVMYIDEQMGLHLYSLK